eukprot:1157807-Pelagomonas_calceolata.AAC.4
MILYHAWAHGCGALRYGVLKVGGSPVLGGGCDLRPGHRLRLMVRDTQAYALELALELNSTCRCSVSRTALQAQRPCQGIKDGITDSMLRYKRNDLGAMIQAARYVATEIQPPSKSIMRPHPELCLQGCRCYCVGSPDLITDLVDERLCVSQRVRFTHHPLNPIVCEQGCRCPAASCPPSCI